MKNGFYIGVDIGGTKISAGLLQGSGRILSRRKIETPQNAKPLEIYRCIKTLIQDLIHSESVKHKNLGGIGLGVPGVVSSDWKSIQRTPNINLSKYPLGENLHRFFQVDVFLGNDVNLGLLAEYWLGAAKGAQNVVGVFPGTGVGGGLIFNGKLYIGSDGAAAELGHMIVDQDSLQSNAGIYGSLEALASRRAIERDIRLAVKTGKRTVVTRLSEGQLSLVKSKILREALKKKDPLTVKVFDEVCQTFGKACISLRHILNPEVIVFGGGLMEACGDYMLPQIRKISNADPFFKGVDRCRIVPSQLGDNAVVLGAVALLQQKQGKDIYLKGQYYPNLKRSPGKSVRFNGKTLPGGFYIRADGRVKKIGSHAIFRDFLQNHRLSSEVLSKICKKNPNILIIGSGRKKLKLTKQAREFLKNESIDYKIFSNTKAIDYYNKTNQRKIIIILPFSKSTRRTVRKKPSCSQ